MSLVEGARGKKREAKEARLSRKAAKGKEFMQTNICDISSLHTPSTIPPPPPLCVCQMLRWGLQKQQSVVFLVSVEKINQ